jgi:hypothetical protein
LQTYTKLEIAGLKIPDQDLYLKTMIYKSKTKKHRSFKVEEQAAGKKRQAVLAFLYCSKSSLPFFACKKRNGEKQEIKFKTD